MNVLSRRVVPVGSRRREGVPKEAGADIHAQDSESSVGWQGDWGTFLDV